MIRDLTTVEACSSDLLRTATSGSPRPATNLNRPLHYLFALACAFTAAVPAALAQGDEINTWPIRVAQADANGSVTSWQGVGPLLFAQPLPNGGSAHGIRPLYLKKQTDAATEVDVLYPLFVYQKNVEHVRWSVFNLINWSQYLADAANGESGSRLKSFDVWPVYFSRDTGDPETSYRAVFPIFGRLQNRFSNERLSWVLFPLYVRTENRGVVGTSYLWPFVRRLSGDGNRGFALWPLYGVRQKPGIYRHEYALWPLMYRNLSRLDEATPRESVAVLPFYMRDRSGENVSETYLWPFFGYVDRTSPYRYHETHYFWPFFVQGRGDERYRNRWAPFYTHSVIKGTEKRWWMWPLLRRETWTDEGLAQTKTQFCYFIYWSLRQRSAANPDLPSAAKTHAWPLLSTWNDGAGRRQLQVFSPFEVFLPHNENVRMLWSPLFAIYRYDQRAPGTTRHSALFNLVSWRKEPERREFHLGPLFSTKKTPESQRIALAGGLLGVRRTNAHGWRPFWFDFSRKSR